MTTIARQKQDLREQLLVITEKYLDKHPQHAHAVAMEASRQLFRTMTLSQLAYWHALRKAQIGEPCEP